MSYGSRIFALCLISCGLAVPVRAQGSEGARISGFYAGALGEGETNVGTGGSVGYRLTPRIGFDFEVLVLPDLELATPAWTAAAWRSSRTSSPSFPVPRHG